MLPNKYSFLVLNAVALTLSITIVYKVKKSTDSEHVKLVVYTLTHVVGFAFVVITRALAMSANTSNMTKVSTVSDKNNRHRNTRIH